MMPMPIFSAGSYHGYDVKDYRAVDPLYVTQADLDALVAACEARDAIFETLDWRVYARGDHRTSKTEPSPSTITH